MVELVQNSSQEDLLCQVSDLSGGKKRMPNKASHDNGDNGISKHGHSSDLGDPSLSFTPCSGINQSKFGNPSGTIMMIYRDLGHGSLLLFVSHYDGDIFYGMIYHLMKR